MQYGADDSEADSAAAVAAFSRVIAYCVTETCRRALVLGHFGEALPHGSCTGCDCCEQPDVVKAQVSTGLIVTAYCWIILSVGSAVRCPAMLVVPCVFEYR